MDFIMNNFTYWSPTKVVFGAGTVGQAGVEAKAFGCTNALVLYGLGSAVKSGVLDTVTAALSAEGIKYTCVGDVQPNPLAEFAQKVVDDFRDKGIDFVLAVGGGSVIDTAKSVANGLASPDIPIWDYFCVKETVKASLPVGVVLTIAAAGSETSQSAVLTNQSTGIKRGFLSPFNRPAFAVMDPELTYTLPLRDTACGIVDILMHTLDRYFAPDADNALTDELAEALMRVTIRYGMDVTKNLRDYKARSELMWAGSLTHNGLTGLGQTLDFSVHQLGHALSGKYGVPHGESLSMMWASWAGYVYTDDPTRFAQYARNIWGYSKSDDDVAAALFGISMTRSFFKGIGAPVSLTEALGEITEDDIDALAELCSYNHTRTIGAFKVLGVEDMKAIYRAAL